MLALPNGPPAAPSILSFYSCSHSRSRASMYPWSRKERAPTRLTTSRSSIVAICDLIPHCTFKPAAFQSCNEKSTFCI